MEPEAKTGDVAWGRARSPGDDAPAATAPPAGTARPAPRAVDDPGREVRPLIAIDGLSVSYQTKGREPILAVERIDLAVGEGEFCVVVGPSGCGKSTLLKVLAGLVKPSGGTATVAGAAAGRNRADIGFVFQQPTLLPWFSVLDNVLLPLKVLGRRIGTAERERAAGLLDLVGLADFARRYPGELSGGMQQRVGLARALVHDPSILLMDEPFGALDALTRETMNQELQSIWLRERKTVVFVTHSISEAVFLGDDVVVMSARPGRILARVPVDLARPRDFEDAERPEFTRRAGEIRRLLTGRTEE